MKLKGQIEEMDKNFQKYKEWLREVFNEQKHLYQTTRKKLQEQLTEAITRLEDAQKDVKDATNSMTRPETAERKEEPQELFDTESEPEEMDLEQRTEGQKRSMPPEIGAAYAALRPFGKRIKEGTPYNKAEQETRVRYTE